MSMISTVTGEFCVWIQLKASPSGAACSLASPGVGVSWNIRMFQETLVRWPLAQAPTITLLAKIPSDVCYRQQALSASTNLTYIFSFCHLYHYIKTRKTTIPHSLTWQTQISFVSSFFLPQQFFLVFFLWKTLRRELAHLLHFVLSRH